MSTTHTRVMNTVTAKIILRGEAINKLGLAPLALQTFVNKERCVISLNIMIPPDNWCDEKRCLIFSKQTALSKTQVQQYNDILTKALNSSLDIRHHFEVSEKLLTAKIFKEEFTSENRKHGFFNFCERELSSLASQGFKEASTIKSIRESVKKLRQFRDELRFSDLNYELLQGFDGYLRRQVGVNTASKHHKNIKALINIAIKKGIRIENPYSSMKVKRVTGNREVLTDQELQALQELCGVKTLGFTTQRVLEAFLFSCFTSIRLSDVKLLNTSHLSNNMLQFIAHKTKNENPKILSIHLSDSAKKYLPTEPTFKLFKLPTDQYINRALKEVMAYIGSRKKVTFHCARHTFATNFLRFDGRIEVLQKILGHTKIETTMIYVHMSKAEIIKQMETMDANYTKVQPLSA